jgi:hypothetical protein
MNRNGDASPAPESSDGEDGGPPRFCPKHPNDTNERCGACGKARKRREAWDAEQSGRREAIKADILAEIAACRHCDQNGFVTTTDADGVDHAERCTRHPSKLDLPTVTP